MRLPGGKSVVVDAKAPLEAYLRAADTQDEDEKRRFLAQHAGDVRGHMKRPVRASEGRRTARRSAREPINV
mgnify:CR=1 FL=1